MSIAQSTGSEMPAACGAGMASDISGTATLPAPEAKPPLLMPLSRTAGMASAQKSGSVTRGMTRS